MNDNQKLYIEVRGATGGDEAKIWASDLLRMYMRYAAKKGWKTHHTKINRCSKLSEYEKDRNKSISKIRHIVEQYFGLSHLFNKAYRARFPGLIKNVLDSLFRQMAFNGYIRVS